MSAILPGALIAQADHVGRVFISIAIRCSRVRCCRHPHDLARRGRSIAMTTGG